MFGGVIANRAIAKAGIRNRVYGFLVDRYERFFTFLPTSLKINFCTWTKLDYLLIHSAYANYIIIGSFIDVDLAEDYAKKLAKNGVGSTILSPAGRGFHRLALGENYGSFADASMQLGSIKGNYGPEVWVLKY